VAGYQSDITSGSASNNNTGAAVLHSTVKSSPTTVLLKTAVAQVYSTYIDANILMDEGAQRSFITQDMVSRLHLKSDGTHVISISAFGDPAQTVQRLDTATVQLVADDGEKIPVRVLIVPVIAKPLSNYFRSCVTNLPYLRGLKLAHPISSDNEFEISMLIGADHYWDIVGDNIVRGNGPTAVASRLGYFLSGPLPESEHRRTSVMDVIAAHVATDVSHFWDIETLGISPEDVEQTCAVDHLKSYQDKCISFEDGKYKARLPWKEDHPNLPTNYEVAKKRTESTVRRLSKDPEMLAQYNKIIQDQERRGFIERVEHEETPTRLH